MLGQQGPEIVLGLGQWQLFKEEVEIAQRLQAVGLGGLDEAIEGSAGGRASGRAGEEPVFPAHGKGADGVLGQVVVGAQASVLEVNGDAVQLPQGIGNGFSEQALGRRGLLPLQDNALILAMIGVALAWRMAWTWSASHFASWACFSR